MHVKMRNSQRSNVWAQYLQSYACSSLLNMHLNLKSARLIAVCKRTLKVRFTRAIFVAIFLILTHAIEWLSHKSIDLYSFAQMV